LESVKDHFEEEAAAFDEIINMIIPHYEKMIQALVDTIPFEKSANIKVLDLGCGTGNVSYKIKKRFPNSEIICLDIAENMIKMAKNKLAEYDDITFKIMDFRNINFKNEFNVVISSLAIHHLIDDEKKKIYKHIYDSLRSRGVFYNADIILGSNDELQNIYMEKWIQHMLKKLSKKEIDTIWLPKHKREDLPAKIIDHITWMEDLGFEGIDVVWKHYYFGVYGGTKH